jgi:XamI restriction endonuclease
VAVNSDKPGRWKADIARSVDLYNDWFMKFAPKAFRETRIETTRQVEEALRWTANLTNVTSEILRVRPGILPMLRMSTCPPIARDRLIGLAGVSPNLVKSMEVDERLPSRMKPAELQADMQKMGTIIEKMEFGL